MSSDLTERCAGVYKTRQQPVRARALKAEQYSLMLRRHPRTIGLHRANERDCETHITETLTVRAAQRMLKNIRPFDLIHPLPELAGQTLISRRRLWST